MVAVVRAYVNEQYEAARAYYGEAKEYIGHKITVITILVKNAVHNHVMPFIERAWELTCFASRVLISLPLYFSMPEFFVIGICVGVMYSEKVTSINKRMQEAFQKTLEKWEYILPVVLVALASLQITIPVAAFCVGGDWGKRLMGQTPEEPEPPTYNQLLQLQQHNEQLLQRAILHLPAQDENANEEQVVLPARAQTPPL